MIETDDFRATLLRVSSILSQQEIAFHFTGGLASSFYGEPRFTQDLDIVLQVASDSRELDGLITRLQEQFILDDQSIKDAVRRRSLFQALDDETMIKVDFHVGEAIPGELGRSRLLEVMPGVTVPLVSKEDAILSKLLWIQKGSHKSRQDVKMMLKDEGAINLPFVEQQARHLGVSELLKELSDELTAG